MTYSGRPGRALPVFAAGRTNDFDLLRGFDGCSARRGLLKPGRSTMPSANLTTERRLPPNIGQRLLPSIRDKLPERRLWAVSAGCEGLLRAQSGRN